MDERTLEAAAAYQISEQERAIAHQRDRIRTYTVIVLGRNNNQPFEIKAGNAQERSDELVAAGVKLKADSWAAGFLNNRRDPDVCGNNDEAKLLVRQHLRKR